MEKQKDALNKVANAAQLAAVIEASTEKPGNVTPACDFHDTTYEDYLAGSIALGASIREAALRGYKTGRKVMRLSEIGIGSLILKGVCDVKDSHSGGNTHLGTIMLMIPLSAAAGACIASSGGFNELRGRIDDVIGESTIEDSRNLYAAIKTASVGGLDALVEKDVPFHELMRISSGRDRIAEELSCGMKISFGTALPAIEKSYEEKGKMREAALDAYLLIISSFPDTFIAKKKSTEKSKEVSSKAACVLDGRLSIEEFDRQLRSEGLNPGTTADLASAALFIWLLKKKVFS
ncbi:MAG: triphosphoribosyl-dephospho-CoA synthase [Candidatus Altiarchaeota archaeon]|nr:triphosphoribosyl-dephospho-CoA synthase [Candidatus Altiarchaeota archaeon]